MEISRPILAVAAMLICALGVLAWLQSRDLQAARTQIGQLEIGMAGARAAQTAAEERAASLDRALAARRTELEAAGARYRELQRQLAKLEKSDAQVRNWLDNPVPAAVRGLLAR